MRRKEGEVEGKVTHKLWGTKEGVEECVCVHVVEGIKSIPVSAHMGSLVS